MEEFIAQLKRHIAELNLDTAIEKLNRLFTASNPKYETDLILLNANWCKLEEQWRLRIISNDDYKLEFNKIVKGLLDLISNVQENLQKYLPFIAGNRVETSQNQKDIILFFGANPKGFEIDIRKELQLISDRLGLFDKRGFFEFKAKLDINPTSFQRVFLELDREPRFFHFGGNALYNDPDYGSGIVLVGEKPNEVRLVDGDILSSIFSNFSSVECVFLNACNTMPFGIKISRHTPFVIAMSHYITDQFAIDFSSRFYEAIGGGKDIKFAFDYSINTLRLMGNYKQEQIETPQLLIQGEHYAFNWHGLSYEEWKDKVNPA